MIAALVATALAQEPAPPNHTDVQWRVRAVPAWPAKADALGYGTVDCRVRLFVNAEGKLDDITFVDCPLVFHDAARDAAYRSSWWPARVNEIPVKAQFVLIYQFRATARETTAPPMRWCSVDERPSMDAFREVASALLVLQQPPEVPAVAEDCRIMIAVDPDGMPVHVTALTSNGAQARRTLLGWCEAQFAPQEPPLPVWAERPCAP